VGRKGVEGQRDWDVEGMDKKYERKGRGKRTMRIKGSKK
jgi:hypothetical protein